MPCFPALETKEEKLVFPPEQHACLPYVDKLSHGLQGCISTVWAGTSSQSYHLGKGCSYSLDFVPPSQLRNWMVITWLWKTLFTFKKLPDFLRWLGEDYIRFTFLLFEAFKCCSCCVCLAVTRIQMLPLGCTGTSACSEQLKMIAWSSADWITCIIQICTRSGGGGVLLWEAITYQAFYQECI